VLVGVAVDEALVPNSDELLTALARVAPPGCAADSSSGGRPRRPLSWSGGAWPPPLPGEQRRLLAGYPAVVGLHGWSAPAPRAARRRRLGGQTALGEAEFAGSDEVVGDVAELPVGRHRGLDQQLEGLIGGHLVALDQDALGLVDDRS
jgi:hypothetical protein